MNDNKKITGKIVNYNSSFVGNIYFNKTLNDWARFDINKRTKFDATISSGLAIMANQKHLYTPQKKESKIKINFAKYSNKGTLSELLN